MNEFGSSVGVGAKRRRRGGFRMTAHSTSNSREPPTGWSLKFKREMIDRLAGRQISIN